MKIPRFYRYPVQVLGYLRTGQLTVVFCPGVGMANGGVVNEIPIHLVPIDLRMPNSEFDVVLDMGTQIKSIVEVLRANEPSQNLDVYPTIAR